MSQATALRCPQCGGGALALGSDRNGQLVRLCAECGYRTPALAPVRPPARAVASAPWWAT